MTKISTVIGWWSTNIGNSFFQLSAKYILEKSGHSVVEVPDFPGYINVKKGNPANSLDIISNLDCDWLILHGPVFRKEYDRINLKSLKKFKSNGGKIACLAAGMMHYDDSMLKYYEQWLKEVPFDFITTRDVNTYDRLKPFCDNICNGIDIALFISDVYPRQELNMNPFVVYNFDQIDEPWINPAKDESSSDFEWRSYNYQINGFKRSEPKNLIAKLKPFYKAYLRKNYQNKFGDLDILRTDHRMNPYLSRKIYKAPNSFAADVPFGYLLIYSNAELTFSNRVHACVATLSYGNEAMYLSNSKRAGLLERIGLTDIYDKPVKLDMDYLREQKSNLLDYILNHF